MKNLFLLVFTASLLASCGGEESTDHENSSNMTDTTSADSVVVEGLSFDDFAQKSAKLPAEDLNSLDSILNWYDVSKASFTQDEKDSSCLIYVEQMYKLTGHVDGEYHQEEEFKESYEPYGFNIGGGEGMLWLITDTEKAAQKFEGDLSKDLREYMRLGEITGKQYSADAGMIISYEDWGDMLIDLEDRIRANRKSKYYSSFVDAYMSYLRWYMWGMDNTPITRWDGEPGLNDEVRKAYEKIIDDKDHRTGEIIQRHWHSLEAGNDYDAPYDQRWILTKEEVEYYLFEEELEPFE